MAAKRPEGVFRKGDRVKIGWEGRTINAEVLIASPNGKSLMLQFEAIIGGYVGMMPVVQDDVGKFHTIGTNEKLTVEARP
jgi:hypothetical protein